MTSDAIRSLTHDSTDAPRRCRWPQRHWRLVVVCAVFLGLRLPVAWRQAPAQDEDYFAVPGYTILHEGIPRIPYMPSRNPQGAFYKADELLFTLPPLYFYWQAVIYSIVGPSTAAARLASMLCGVAAIVVVYRLALLWFRSEWAALWSAGLYAASRVVYFPVETARPDMLCGLLGLATLLATAHWNETRRRSWLMAAGIAIGANALTHPFAIVPAVQVTVWVLIVSGGWKVGLRNLATLVAVATPVFLMWGLLIAQQPEAFRAQFFNAVLNQSGPGLLSRLVLPLPSLRAQAPMFAEHAGTMQAALMLAGVVAATAFCFRVRQPAWRTLVALTWSAIYLHVAFVGRHPTKGYWCYTGALMFLCAGTALTHLLRQSRPATAPEPRWRFRDVAAVIVAAAMMLPGAGLRTVVAHLRHWNDVNYDARRFTQALITAVPEDAKLVVDPTYIFDFYRAGRNVTLALDYEFFFSVRGTDYAYVVAGPYALRDRIPEALNAKLLRTYGDRSDPFACYSEVFASPGGPTAVKAATP